MLIEFLLHLTISQSYPSSAAGQEQGRHAEDA